jgi:hypothetical protein
VKEDIERLAHAARQAVQNGTGLSWHDSSELMVRAALRTIRNPTQSQKEAVCHIVDPHEMDIGPGDVGDVVAAYIDHLLGDL